jgi:hypothetical protein
MSRGRQRAKSLQWESDLGLISRSETASKYLLSENRWREVKTSTFSENGIGDPCALNPKANEPRPPPERWWMSSSLDSRIVFCVDDVQAQHTQSPEAPSSEPATGRKGDRKSRKCREPTKSVCARCRGINIDNVCSEQGYRHSSMEDISISAQSCHFRMMLYTADHTFENKWTTACPGRYQLCISFESVERCFDSHGMEAEETFLRLEAVYVEDIDQERRSRIPIGRLACFTLKHDPAADAGIYWTRKLGSNTASEISFEVAREWLQSCIASDISTEPHVMPKEFSERAPEVHEDHAWSETDIHLNTKVERLPVELPKRLVDLAPSRLGPHTIHVIETRGLTFEYVTLSYCWGFPHGGGWLTTKLNVTERADTLATVSMPKTIRYKAQRCWRCGIAV